ncbi:MAG TPA: SDR family NAD(P)-dependent oxidoreductase [Acidobacteriota bacterium]|nr:SDR family NAD(P)-dependent oxidoreductase [Acidobacteriota bacterium]
MDLQNKVVVITGASSGIGRETALALGREKCRLVLAARRQEKLESVRRQVEEAGGKAVVAPADVSRNSDVEELVKTALVQFGRIDVLINNAGSGLLATLEETTPEQMERIWRTNFLSTFTAIRSVLPVMKKQGSGHIVTVSSIAGRRATPLQAAYCASKFAQAGLMESLRIELRGSRVRCTTIFAGPTDTEFLTALENPGKRSARYHGKVLPAAAVASRIVEALRNPKSEIITQRFGRALLVLNALTPSAVDWMVTRFVKRKLLQEEKTTKSRRHKASQKF